MAVLILEKARFGVTRGTQAGDGRKKSLDDCRSVGCILLLSFIAERV